MHRTETPGDPLPYRPFVLAALPRSGSYMLASALDAHPRVRCAGEALSPWRQDLGPFGSAAELLRREVYTDRPGPAAVGFKLLPQDGRGDRLGDAREFLRDLGVTVIHLVRRNLLRQVLSFAVAEQTDVWILEAGASRPRPAPVALDPARLVQRFAELEARQRRHEEELRGEGGPTLRVAYEDLVADRSGEMARIFALLGVEPRSVAPSTRRQEKRPLPRAITNYPEVAAALRGSRWESFLADGDA